MQVSRVQANYMTNIYSTRPQTEAKARTVRSEGLSRGESQKSYTSVPVGFKYGANIHFGEYIDPNRTVPHIDYEEYLALKPAAKERLRRRYKTFLTKKTNKNGLFDNKYTSNPLSNEKTIASFFDIAKMYSKYKGQPIICLGRSPKWFLNTSLWMKDGIDGYDFVAFSKYWYRPDPVDGVKFLPQMAPTEKEEKAYRKYLDRVQADPKSIVAYHEATGKKTVITDFIATGKGACSFLDIMGRYAKDEGLLEKFSKAIEFVGIGSMDYLEDLDPYADSISEPSVPMPPVLQKYERNIKQSFHNISNYAMFNDMLMNQNVNECRSTYYPHQAWTIYQPDKFKTGLIKDMSKVKEIRDSIPTKKGDSMSHFSPAMFDFRNLLSFHIFDELDNQNLLINKEDREKAKIRFKATKKYVRELKKAL